MGTDMWTMIEVSNDGEPWRTTEKMPRALRARRDYVLFSLLADVANRGKHHEPTWQEPRTVTLENGDVAEIPGWWYDPDEGGHEPIEYIDKPRGVPADASDDWLATVLMWKTKSSTVDVTWVTPEEIVNAPWDQQIIMEGMVTEAEYAALREGTLPKNHVQNVGGPAVTVVSETEYAEGKRAENGGVTYIKASWSAGTARDASGYILEAMKEILATLPASYRVRLMLLFEA